MKPAFRRPELYITLMSDVARSRTKSHAVYSMVAADEFTIRTPDALINGLATEQVIAHCCPSIEIHTLLACDVQHILSVIRIATSGNNMDLQIRCPQCSADDPYEINLQQLMPALSAKLWFTPFSIDGLVIALQPAGYREQQQYELEKFRVSKQLIQLSQLTNADDYQELIMQLVEQRRQLAFSFRANRIQSVQIPEGPLVTDPKFIREWFFQTDLEIQQQIIEQIVQAEKQCYLPKLETVCAGCKNKNTIPIDLDFSMLFRYRLLYSSEQEIVEELDSMKHAKDELARELMRTVWYMRGSVSYADAYNLSWNERKVISKIIEDNIEATKKSGIALI